MSGAFTKIFEFIQSIIGWFKFWIVMNEYERGIVLRLGRYHRTLAAGLHWTIPFGVESVEYENVRKRNASSWDMTHTVNGKSYTISIQAVIRITNIKKACMSTENWQNVAYSIMCISGSSFLSSSTIDQINSAEFIQMVKDKVNEDLAVIGVEATDFGLQDKVPTRAIKLFMGVK